MDTYISRSDLCETLQILSNELLESTGFSETQLEQVASCLGLASNMLNNSYVPTTAPKLLIYGLKTRRKSAVKVLRAKRSIWLAAPKVYFTAR